MRTITVILLVALSATTRVRAQHVGDIALLNDDGAVATADILPDFSIVPQRVFPAILGDSGFPGFTSNPGFFADPGTFDPVSRLGWNATDGLAIWNGAGFDPADDEQLVVSFLTASFVVADAPAPGFDLQVATDGGFHKHLNFFLEDPIDGVPDPGVYRLALEVYSTDPSVATSDPLWIVFDHEADPGALEAALDWQRAQLDAPCAGDVDGDDQVGFTDLLQVLASWGACADCAADLDESGAVDFADLLILLTNWGPCAP